MNPYQSFPERSFWSPAVGKRKPLAIDELYAPKFPVTAQDKIATFGSCFAQHFSRELVARGFHWTNFEPGPEGLDDEAKDRFNYRVFSARTGNIYTANMLRQWCQWATGVTPPDEVWVTGGRFYDPFRPAIEPGGFESEREMRESRELAIEAFADVMAKTDVLVFTLGLTEAWRRADDSCEYALCPGTVAGEFDPTQHVFVNEGFLGVTTALQDAIALLRSVNPTLRLLLTVSPVPLTATASASHVLVATTYSKSVLRAVAGELSAADPAIDYFPSYEIITAPPFQGRFFAANKRSVLPEGVAHVMEQFFKGQVTAFGEGVLAAAEPEEAADADGEAAADALVCEEALLDAFGPRVQA